MLSCRYIQWCLDFSKWALATPTQRIALSEKDRFRQNLVSSSLYHTSLHQYTPDMYDQENKNIYENENEQDVSMEGFDLNATLDTITAQVLSNTQLLATLVPHPSQ